MFAYDAYDEMGPLATMGDAHREWHRNTGVPMGTPGCPQDACHPDPDWYEATYGELPSDELVARVWSGDLELAEDRRFEPEFDPPF